MGNSNGCLLKEDGKVLSIVWVNCPTLLLTVCVDYSYTQSGLEYPIFFEKYLELVHQFLKIRVRKITFPLVIKLRVTLSSIMHVIYNSEIWQRLLCMSRVHFLPSS